MARKLNKLQLQEIAFKTEILELKSQLGSAIRELQFSNQLRQRLEYALLDIKDFSTDNLAKAFIENQLQLKDIATAIHFRSNQLPNDKGESKES